MAVTRFRIMSREYNAGLNGMGSVRTEMCAAIYLTVSCPDPSEFAGINHLVDAAPERLA
jgi:hypothetical protein